MYKLLTENMVKVKKVLEEEYGEVAEELLIYQVANLKLAVYDVLNELGVYKFMDWIFKIKE